MKVLEWSQHFSHYKSMGFFPDAQGQLTHKSLVRSCWSSNPFEILWLSLLPARIKKNKSKMKELEWSQDFPHYNPMGAICCHGNQSSDQSSDWKWNSWPFPEFFPCPWQPWYLYIYIYGSAHHILVLITYAQASFKCPCWPISSKASSLYIGLSLHLHPYFLWIPTGNVLLSL